MGETTGARSSTWRATATDLWRWQLQALADLTEFVQEHGPRDRQPLCGLDWRVGTTRSLSADIWSYATEPMETLAAYAAAFGTEVQSNDQGDRVYYRVRGRIGVREGTKHEPRTQVVITFTEWRD
jgi:hypothetical protein